MYTIQLTGKQLTSQKHRRSPTFTKYEVLKIEKSNKQPTYHSTYRLFTELFTPCIPTKLSILHRKHPRMFTQTKSAINFIHHNRNPHLHPHILQHAKFSQFILKFAEIRKSLNLEIEHTATLICQPIRSGHSEPYKSRQEPCSTTAR